MTRALSRTAVRRRPPTAGQLDLAAEVESWWSTLAPPVPAPSAPAREVDPLSGIGELALVHGGPAVPSLSTVRVGRMTHLVPGWAEHAVCGAPLGPVVAAATGERVTCAACALPPEAD